MTYIDHKTFLKGKAISFQFFLLSSVRFIQSIAFQYAFDFHCVVASGISQKRWQQDSGPKHTAVDSPYKINSLPADKAARMELPQG